MVYETADGVWVQLLGLIRNSTQTWANHKLSLILSLRYDDVDACMFCSFTPTTAISMLACQPCTDIQHPLITLSRGHLPGLDMKRHLPTMAAALGISKCAMVCRLLCCGLCCALPCCACGATGMAKMAPLFKTMHHMFAGAIGQLTYDQFRERAYNGTEQARVRHRWPAISTTTMAWQCNTSLAHTLLNCTVSV